MTRAQLVADRSILGELVDILDWVIDETKRQVAARRPTG